jgi:hypothetical protein
MSYLTEMENGVDLYHIYIEPSEPNISDEDDGAMTDNLNGRRMLQFSDDGIVL